ncbi:MAG: CopG family ribbon-helix-helix protein [Sporichthyaceae bacterium]
MRMHIELDDDLVARLDALAGPRGRSDFVRDAIRVELDRQERRQAFREAAGSIADTGHDWDDDPAAWVHEQRFSDPRRVG